MKMKGPLSLVRLRGSKQTYRLPLATGYFASEVIKIEKPTESCLPPVEANATYFHVETLFSISLILVQYYCPMLTT